MRRVHRRGAPLRRALRGVAGRRVRVRRGRRRQHHDRRGRQERVDAHAANRDGDAQLLATRRRFELRRRGAAGARDGAHQGELLRRRRVGGCRARLG